MELGKSFTAKAEGIANVLMSQCGVCVAFDPLSGKEHPPIKPYQGLWDTGASCTVITKKIVDELGLKPIGKTKVLHADGESTVNVYYVNIFLPNQVGFKFIRVTEGKLSGFDLLIGMDLISCGDFAVTNFGGNTTFSFRVPSLEEIDFNKQKVIQKPLVAEAKPSQNEPCPCGSGKKYKRCHGLNK
jgi:predicted aspartyl protease